MGIAEMIDDEAEGGIKIQNVWELFQEVSYIVHAARPDQMVHMWASWAKPFRMRGDWTVAQAVKWSKDDDLGYATCIKEIRQFCSREGRSALIQRLTSTRLRSDDFDFVDQILLSEDDIVALGMFFSPCKFFHFFFSCLLISF